MPVRGPADCPAAWGSAPALSLHQEDGTCRELAVSSHLTLSLSERTPTSLGSGDTYEKPCLAESSYLILILVVLGGDGLLKAFLCRQIFYYLILQGPRKHPERVTVLLPRVLSGIQRPQLCGMWVDQNITEKTLFFSLFSDRKHSIKG